MHAERDEGRDQEDRRSSAECAARRQTASTTTTIAAGDPASRRQRCGRYSVLHRQAPLRAVAGALVEPARRFVLFGYHERHIRQTAPSRLIFGRGEQAPRRCRSPRRPGSTAMYATKRLGNIVTSSGRASSKSKKPARAPSTSRDERDVRLVFDQIEQSFEGALHQVRGRGPQRADARHRSPPSQSRDERAISAAPCAPRGAMRMQALTRAASRVVDRHARAALRALALVIRFHRQFQQRNDGTPYPGKSIAAQRR